MFKNNVESRKNRKILATFLRPPLDKPTENRIAHILLRKNEILILLVDSFPCCTSVSWDFIIFWFSMLFSFIYLPSLIFNVLAIFSSVFPRYHCFWSPRAVLIFLVAHFQLKQHQKNEKHNQRNVFLLFEKQRKNVWVANVYPFGPQPRLLSLRNENFEPHDFYHSKIISRYFTFDIFNNKNTSKNTDHKNRVNIIKERKYFRKSMSIDRNLWPEK